MSAATLDILIEEGASFSRTLIFKDANAALVDLTGQTFTGKIKKNVTDTDAVATFTCTVLNQVTNKGEVTIELTAAQTAAIDVQPQTVQARTIEKFCYDLQRTLVSGAIERVLQGVVNVSPSVTNP